MEVCPYLKSCGGCQGQNRRYESYCSEKDKNLKKKLEFPLQYEGFVPMETPYYYRHKVQSVFGHDSKGRPLCGNYGARTHRLVPIEHCAIEDQKAQAIIRSVKSLLPSFKIKTFDEDTGYGLLRHVQVRVGFHTGEIMVVLVASSTQWPGKRHFVQALLNLHPDITTILLNVNPARTSMVLGERFVPLYGPGFIYDILCGLRFRLSPASFFQINPLQTEKLYAKALAYAGLTGTENVLDAYCGIGTIGMAAAGQSGQVTGVELNAAAVRDAIANARFNQVKNIRFFQGDAGQFLVQSAGKSAPFDVVFLDPPRSGTTPVFIQALAKAALQRVVYISCNPETLVRDLHQFTSIGYFPVKACGVDMFPWTEHVESVVLLTRKGLPSR